MRFEVCIVLVLAVVASVCSQKPADNKVDDSRSFVTGLNFTTFTLIKWTTTSVSTLTSTLTCTTSTAALTTCTAGRRRRGLFYDDGEAAGRNRRGLFYNDEEVDNKDGSVFLVKRSNDPKDEVQPIKKVETPLIPLELQSGYTLPQDLEASRFLLAFGTSTVISYTITTSTSSLTATCSSVTNFPTCGNTGK